MTNLDPVEVAIAQAEDLLTAVSNAFQMAALGRPDVVMDTEHLRALVTTADGAMTMLSVFLEEWRIVLKSNKY